jgi:hypothetical protein
MDDAAFTHDVFLSHSAKDMAVVRPLAERLRQDGLKVWFDECISTFAEVTTNHRSSVVYACNKCGPDCIRVGAWKNNYSLSCETFIKSAQE